MKRFVYILLSLLLCISFLLYWGNERVGAKLATSKSTAKQVDDFILHIHAETADNGALHVFRSIQYVGNDPIKIEHQTPLISVSFIEKKHDFTGSTVSKKLMSGASYYPDNKISFPAPKKGEHTLFVEARVIVNGERITIEHQEKLIFK